MFKMVSVVVALWSFLWDRRWACEMIMWRWLRFRGPSNGVDDGGLSEEGEPV